MPNRHAILGPSGADKWVSCPPSARFEEQIFEEESTFAREGTLAHDLAALVLSSRAGLFKGDNILFWEEVAAIKSHVFDFYKDSDKDAEAEYNAMWEHAEGWAAFVCDLGTRDSELTLADEYEIYIDSEAIAEVSIEREFNLSHYIPLGFGTSDATVKTPLILYVNDYKYGAGKRVHAKNNKQGMLYALGALRAALSEDPSYNPETVIVAIYQPRVSGGETSFAISVSDLLDWAETVVKPAAILAISGQGDFKAGTHCQFCKARTVCKKYFDIFGQVKGIHDKRTMTAKELEIVLTYGDLIAAWVKKVKEDTARKMLAGTTVHGFKLVAGGSRRTFTSEDDAIDAAMGADIDIDKLLRTELLPLTEIEKVVGKKKFAEVFGPVMFDKEYGPKVVDWDDPAPEIGRTAHDDYNDDVI